MCKRVSILSYPTKLKFINLCKKEGVGSSGITSIHEVFDPETECKESGEELVQDFNVEKEIERDALNDEVEVLIIGGGFGGMLAGVRLRQEGIDDFRIVEKGANFGGTWYWNRYPGASCDIESYIYFPLLEETGFVPKQKYTNARETLEYCHVIAEKYNLYEISFGNSFNVE